MADFKKGTCRYHATYYGDKPEISEWIFRSKRGDYGYLVKK